MFNPSKLRIKAFQYLGTSGALQIPLSVGKLPPSIHGVLVNNQRIILEKGLDFETHLFILCHELIHFILKHLERGRGKNAEVWGLAIDHVVNTIIYKNLKLVNNSWIKSQGYVLFDGYSIPDGPAELIYRMILKQKNEVERKGGSKFTFGGTEFELVPRLKQDSSKITGSYKKIGNHGGSGNKSLLGEGATYEFNESLKGIGKVSNDLNRELDQVFKPQVPWYKIITAKLSAFLGKKSFTPTYTKIPYYQMGSIGQNQVRLPYVMKKEISLITALDVSGSISKFELGKYISELQLLKKIVTDNWVYIIDAKIQELLHNPTPEVVIQNLRGGGGTDFRPVFKDIEERRLKPTMLVYFTDTYGSFPERAPKYPVMWVVVKSHQTENVKVPFGRLVLIN